MTDLDRTPPCSPDMERAVLGAMMIEEDALNHAFMHITEETFYKPQNQTVFRAMKLLWEENTAIDLLTLPEKLKDIGLLDKIGGDMTLVGIMNETSSAANIKYHCDELLEKESLRKIIALCTAAINYAYEEKHESKVLLYRLSDKFDKIIDKSKTNKIHSMDEVIQAGFKIISDRFESKDGLIGLPTGYLALDKVTGGWQKGDMIVVAARSSMGKTSLVLELAVRTAHKGVSVGIFSLETTYRKLGMRMISTKARQSVNNLSEIEDKTTVGNIFNAAAKKLNQLPIWVDDSSTATAGDIRAHAKRMQKLYRIQLLIIDYLQIISGDNPKDTPYKKITDIARSIKATAKALDIPIILLSQLRRAKQGEEHKAPLLSDLLLSGQIENESDIIMFIHDPPEQWKKDYLTRHHIPYQDDDLSTKRQIRVAKNRDGAKMVSLFNWHGKYFSFEEISGTIPEDMG